MPATPTPRPRRKAVIQPVSMALVLKATDDSDPVACYDQSGRLMGICDPKDITPVANADSPPQPKPTRSAQTTAAAGEDPELGIQKARAAALAIKKGLYAGGDVGDREKLANAMNAAAIEAEKRIHGRRPGRRP